MGKNLNQASSSVLAEAFYVLATQKGIADAHDFVREASRESEAKGQDLLDVLVERQLFEKSVNKKELFDRVLKGSYRKFQEITSKW